ncbi:MAG: hypothetical protein JNK08_09685 [Sediminibacterium sp.]|nr:hypothetical protein [Sediminibacterium sp.]
MQKFCYEICIEAKTDMQAENKMKALAVLASKLSTKELAQLADIIKNDPIKTALAKRYLGV